MRVFGVIDSTRESERRAPSSVVSRTAPTPSMMPSRRVMRPPADSTRAPPWSMLVGAAKRTMTSVEAAGAAGAAHISAISALAPAATLQRRRSGERTVFKGGFPSMDRVSVHMGSAPLGRASRIRTGNGRLYDAASGGALGAVGGQAPPHERLGVQALLERLDDGRAELGATLG